MAEANRAHLRQLSQYLGLLSRFHFVVAALAVVATALPVVHFLLGLAIFSGRLNGNGGALLNVLAWVLMIGSAGFILCGWGLAALLCVAGRRLVRRERYVFCLIVAAIACAFVPFGTVLGTFTVIVLTRPGVRTLFGLEEVQSFPLDLFSSEAPPPDASAVASERPPED